MKRRTFVKGLFFCIPSIYLNPVLSLCTKLPDVRLSQENSRAFLIFIGEYGRKIMNQCLRMQPTWQVIRPCLHTRADINLVNDLIYMDGSKDLAPPLLSKSLIIIVFDGFVYEDRKLAALLATYYQQAQGNYAIAIVSNASINIKKSLYNLVLTQRWMDYDIPARVIRSLYNTYCGCSGIGNLVCLKAHLDDFGYAHVSSGQVLAAVSFRSFDDPVYRKLKLDASLATFRIVETEYQNALLYAIIEMPAKIKDPIHAMEKIEFELSGGNVDHFRSLPHPNATDGTFRLTLLKLT